jgi:HAD superfamily hydrolase (TIGR01509 family)
MSTIKNVIFDLGGVLLNIDYNRTTNAFKQLGYTDFENMYSMLKGNNVFDNLETGHITEDEFYQYMTNAAAGTVSNQQVQDAWNAMLLDFRSESLKHLQLLREKQKIFLLSNTNIIHKKAFDQLFMQQTGVPSLDEYFDKAYYSQKVGLRKPNADIFEFVLKDAEITAGESFYIDDLPPNIETARKLGFKTHLLLPGEKIEHLRYDW